LYENEYHDLVTYEEVIKVRFSEDVKITVKMTRNGVLIDRDFIDGAGADIVPFIPADWLNSD
jgi:acyl-homoserine lactone acylase PvdQ